MYRLDKETLSFSYDFLFLTAILNRHIISVRKFPEKLFSCAKLFNPHGKLELMNVAIDTFTPPSPEFLRVTITRREKSKDLAT